MTMTSKYAPLKQHLAGQNYDHISMSFSEIEKIIGFKLPPSARKHRPWWSNNAANSVITYAWLDAGYKTEQVDMAQEKLVFRRFADIEPDDGDDNHSDHDHDDELPKPKGFNFVDFFGSMKSLITIRLKMDLTATATPQG